MWRCTTGMAMCIGMAIYRYGDIALVSPTMTLKWCPLQYHSEARFRLYPRRFLRLNRHFSRFFEIRNVVLAEYQNLSFFETFALFFANRICKK